MTDTLGYIGVALPDGYKIQKDTRGRDVLVLEADKAEFFGYLMENGVRNLRETHWEGIVMLDPQDDKALDRVVKRRLVLSDRSIMVSSEIGGTVQVSSLDGYELHPIEAYELSIALRNAAHHAALEVEDS